MYLLDTNVVSNLRKAKPHPRLLDWISSADESQLCVSVATITEIQMGIERLKRDGQPAKATEVATWLANLVATRRIVPLSTEAAELWGKMLESPLRDGSFRANAPRRFKSNWTLDLMIASVAVASELTVVTENTRDFQRINQHFKLPGLLNPIKDGTDDGTPPPGAHGL